MSVVHLRLSINDDRPGIWTGLSFDSVQFSGGSPVAIDELNDSATLRAVSRCPFMRAVRAFSLIELLVVVAIIGVLVGITLPVLSRARRLAFTARELAAGQQIMTAYACYAQENKDAVLPGVANGSVTPPDWKPDVDAYTLYHASVGYTGIKNLGITFGVRNLLDKDPPFSAAYDSNTGAGSSWEPRVADPRGRSFTLTVDYKFF